MPYGKKKLTICFYKFNLEKSGRVPSKGKNLRQTIVFSVMGVPDGAITRSGCGSRGELPLPVLPSKGERGGISFHDLLF